MITAVIMAILTHIILITIRTGMDIILDTGMDFIHATDLDYTIIIIGSYFAILTTLSGQISAASFSCSLIRFFNKRVST